jgi:hypothetical protein
VIDSRFVWKWLTPQSYGNFIKVGKQWWTSGFGGALFFWMVKPQVFSVWKSRVASNDTHQSIPKMIGYINHVLSSYLLVTHHLQNIQNSGTDTRTQIPDGKTPDFCMVNMLSLDVTVRQGHFVRAKVGLQRAGQGQALRPNRQFPGADQRPLRRLLSASGRPRKGWVSLKKALDNHRGGSFVRQTCMLLMSIDKNEWKP